LRLTVLKYLHFFRAEVGDGPPIFIQNYGINLDQVSRDLDYIVVWLRRILGWSLLNFRPLRLPGYRLRESRR
jgi:hypothetical protein